MMNFSDIRDTLLAATIAVLIVLAWINPPAPPAGMAVTGGSQYVFPFITADTGPEPFPYKVLDRASGVENKFDVREDKLPPFVRPIYGDF